MVLCLGADLSCPLPLVWAGPADTRRRRDKWSKGALAAPGKASVDGGQLADLQMQGQAQLASV